jgi:hypothetical protein
MSDTDSTDTTTSSVSKSVRDMRIKIINKVKEAFAEAGASAETQTIFITEYEDAIINAPITKKSKVTFHPLTKQTPWIAFNSEFRNKYFDSDEAKSITWKTITVEKDGKTRKVGEKFLKTKELSKEASKIWELMDDDAKAHYDKISSETNQKEWSKWNKFYDDMTDDDITKHKERLDLTVESVKKLKKRDLTIIAGLLADVRDKLNLDDMNTKNLRDLISTSISTESENMVE